MFTMSQFINLVTGNPDVRWCRVHWGDLKRVEDIFAADHVDEILALFRKSAHGFASLVAKLKNLSNNFEVK